MRAHQFTEDAVKLHKRNRYIRRLHQMTGWDISHLELLSNDELSHLHMQHQQDNRAPDNNTDDVDTNEAQSAAVRMQRALQREKEKREFSQRYAEKNFPIGKKPDPIEEPKKTVAEGAKKRCMQCGMPNCKCAPGKCKCKPVAGWIPNKGFKKAVDEAANAAQQAAIAIAKKKKKGVAEGSETYKQGHAKFRTKTNKQIGPTHYGRGSDKKADSYTKADPRYHEVRPVKEQGVAEGMFGIEDKIKGKIQNIVSDLSDIPGMWDHSAQTFTPTGLEKLKSVLKNNPKYIKYAVNLTADDYNADLSEQGVAEGMCEVCGTSLAEHGKASLKLCKSSRPDSELGASNLASCKSQGLRARDGDKSHKLGRGPESRVKVGGHKIKGKKYGGPLPDWS
jgi:hypothetical protein